MHSAVLVPNQGTMGKSWNLCSILSSFHVKLTPGIHRVNLAYTPSKCKCKSVSAGTVPTFWNDK